VGVNLIWEVMGLGNQGIKGIGFLKFPHSRKERALNGKEFIFSTGERDFRGFKRGGRFHIGTWDLPRKEFY